MDVEKSLVIVCGNLTVLLTEEHHICSYTAPLVLLSCTTDYLDVNLRWRLKLRFGLEKGQRAHQWFQFISCTSTIWEEKLEILPVTQLLHASAVTAFSLLTLSNNPTPTTRDLTLWIPLRQRWHQPLRVGCFVPGRHSLTCCWSVI